MRLTVNTNINHGDRNLLYNQLLDVAKQRTALADVKLGEDGKPVDEEESLDLGENVIIVERGQ